MGSILISTSTNHNCGDDFIRQGCMELLNVKDKTSLFWWNRGYGISNAYENDLKINLQHMDYFIVAGTPEWIYRNEAIYKYCLKHDIPCALLGVGTSNIFSTSQSTLMKKIAQANLCEVALARDENAANLLSKLSFTNIDLIFDPAFFIPVNNAEIKDQLNILTWQKVFFGKKHPNLMYDYPMVSLRRRLSFIKNQRRLKHIKNQYDDFMCDLFSSLPDPKLVVVHENHEVAEAKLLFGSSNVFFSSDYNLIYNKYIKAHTFIGSRIHGAIPAIINGANIQLVYPSQKAKVLETAKSIINKYDPEIADKLIKICYLPEIPFKGEYSSISQSKVSLQNIIASEKERVRKILHRTHKLSEYLNIS